MTPDLVALSRTQGDVFSGPQALACGITRNELRRWLDHRTIVALRRGIFTMATMLDGADKRRRHELDVAAALLVRDPDQRWPGTLDPGTRLAAGHSSAALLWGIDAEDPPILRPRPGRSSPAVDPETLERQRIVQLVSADRCRRTYRWGVEVRPSSLPPEHLTALGVLPITTMARTAIDLARECTWVWAVIAVDSAMRLGTTRGELTDMAGFCAQWRGGIQAMRAAEFARKEAQSAAESFARALFQQHGLPEPEIQFDIRDENGEWVARVDLLFRAQRTAVETDGKIKYSEPWGDPRETLWKEKLREDRIRDCQYEVVRVTWQQLMTDPEGVIARVRRAFARAARLAV